MFEPTLLLKTPKNIENQLLLGNKEEKILFEVDRYYMDKLNLEINKMYTDEDFERSKEDLSKAAKRFIKRSSVTLGNTTRKQSTTKSYLPTINSNNIDTVESLANNRSKSKHKTVLLAADRSNYLNTTDVKTPAKARMGSKIGSLKQKLVQTDVKMARKAIIKRSNGLTSFNKLDMIKKVSGSMEKELGDDFAIIFDLINIKSRSVEMKNKILDSLSNPTDTASLLVMMQEYKNKIMALNIPAFLKKKLVYYPGGQLGEHFLRHLE